ncbi:MAG: hypothetical protein ACKVUS_17600 [Saprospiraceae bacterium]
MESQALRLKDNILIMLANVQDVPSLQKVQSLLFNLRQSEQVVEIEEENDDDWVEDMPPELEADLALALEEIEHPQNWISAEEAEKRLAKWRL